MNDPKEYMAKAKAQMDVWSAEITKMQGQMMKAGKDAQDQMLTQMEVQMEALKAQRKQVEARMEEMGKANVAATRDVQAKMENAWVEMEKQMADARKKMMG